MYKTHFHFEKFSNENPA